ncbi:Cytochrome P450 [Mycena venus]|uniref:Cytochrome P450 n=1 Tax=Mycena venus TaxID=2733690 RepID=A0A8H7D374_9AGAR|nr:Cytochrome P450 [Mycena venus]
MRLGGPKERSTHRKIARITCVLRRSLLLTFSECLPRVTELKGARTSLCAHLVPRGASTPPCLAALPVFIHYTHKSRRPSLPPGPRGLPLVGNILDVPSGDIWLKFSQMGDAWGNISSLTVFGQTMVIVNSLEVAEDLLDVRGANFSDRLVIPMGGELVGFNNALSLSQYGDRVRTERKLFHRLFGSQSAIKQFVPLVSSEIRKLLQKITLNPGDACGQIGRTMGAISIRIAYGYELEDGPQEDPYLAMFETVANNFATSTAPGTFMIDIVPALRYWPQWLPGGGFHITAKAWAKQLHNTINDSYNYVKGKMAAGTAENCFVTNSLEEQIHDDHLIKWAAASIQVGGSDTTAAQLEGFLLAMSLYPDVQLAAQKELDDVVGNERLPDISDRSQLPYIDALCKEVLRWHVCLPTGIPHCAREDFIYDRGGGNEPVLIPKGAAVIPNIWKMTHDLERYANPMVFDPSRFITTSVKGAELDPTQICFGFGRRICPGRLLADTALFMACSSILAVFNISRPRENGRVCATVLRSDCRHCEPCFDPEPVLSNGIFYKGVTLGVTSVFGVSKIESSGRILVTNLWLVPRVRMFLVSFFFA